jgi:hypothetical protein
MPTVLRAGTFRFHFYSNECDEPPHIHVRTPEGECKFWLDPVQLASGGGLRPHRLRSLKQLVLKNHLRLLAAYHEFHRFR